MYVQVQGQEYITLQRIPFALGYSCDPMKSRVAYFLVMIVDFGVDLKIDKSEPSKSIK